LPLEAVVLASGIKEKNVTKEKFRIIVKTEKSDDIYFDLKEKSAIIGKEKVNLGDALLVKNNEIFLSTDYVEKIFKVKIEKNGNTVIMRYKLFPINQLFV